MRLSYQSSAQESVKLSVWLTLCWKHKPSAPASHLIQTTIPLKTMAQIRRRRRNESCLKSYSDGAVWGCKHWSSGSSLEQLFFNAAFHHQLDLRFEVWPILNPSILLSRVHLNRGNSKRPIKSREKSRTWSLMTLNQIILWQPIHVERTVCKNMWLGIEQNK